MTAKPLAELQNEIERLVGEHPACRTLGLRGLNGAAAVVPSAGASPHDSWK